MVTSLRSSAYASVLLAVVACGSKEHAKKPASLNSPVAAPSAAPSPKVVNDSSGLPAAKVAGPAKVLSPSASGETGTKSETPASFGAPAISESPEMQPELSSQTQLDTLGRNQIDPQYLDGKESFSLKLSKEFGTGNRVSFCLDSRVSRARDVTSVQATKCEKGALEQQFKWTASGELKTHDGRCLTVLDDWTANWGSEKMYMVWPIACSARTDLRVFRLEESKSFGEPTFQIRSFWKQALCLNVHHGGEKPEYLNKIGGYPVVAFPCDRAHSHQKWRTMLEGFYN